MADSMSGATGEINLVGFPKKSILDTQFRRLRGGLFFRSYLPRGIAVMVLVWTGGIWILTNVCVTAGVVTNVAIPNAVDTEGPFLLMFPSLRFDQCHATWTSNSRDQ